MAHACPLCDRRFASSGSLRQHMVIHTAERRHSCTTCCDTFARLADLKHHKLVVHEGLSLLPS